MLKIGTKKSMGRCLEIFGHTTPSTRMSRAWKQLENLWMQSWQSALGITRKTTKILLHERSHPPVTTAWRNTSRDVSPTPQRIIPAKGAIARDTGSWNFTVVVWAQAPIGWKIRVKAGSAIIQLGVNNHTNYIKVWDDLEGNMMNSWYKVSRSQTWQLGPPVPSMLLLICHKPEIKINEVWVDSATEANANISLSTKVCTYKEASLSVKVNTGARGNMPLHDFHQLYPDHTDKWTTHRAQAYCYRTQFLQWNSDPTARCSAYNGEIKARRSEASKPSFYMIVLCWHIWTNHLPCYM